MIVAVFEGYIVLTKKIHAVNTFAWPYNNQLILLRYILSGWNNETYSAK